MKDAYSFDRDDDGMRESYRVMYEAYERVFRRCGLEFVVVEADPGQIGGGINHEYMAVAEVGEDLFVRCESGDYLADTEAAVPGRTAPAAGEPAPLVVVDSPDSETIEKLCAVLGVTAEHVVSEDCARQMADAAREVLGADVGIAVTGVAGPETQDDQPVGTVWFGISIPGARTEAVSTRLPGDRERIRQFSTISLLNLLRMRLDALA